VFGPKPLCICPELASELDLKCPFRPDSGILKKEVFQDGREGQDQNLPAGGWAFPDLANCQTIENLIFAM
jgi:hypothetical protein